MTALDKMTDEQFERHALDILRRELGAAGFARYLRLHRSGLGDYTRDRAQWLGGQTVESIAESIERRRTAE